MDQKSGVHSSPLHRILETYIQLTKSTSKQSQWRIFSLQLKVRDVYHVRCAKERINDLARANHVALLRHCDSKCGIHKLLYHVLDGSEKIWISPMQLVSAAERFRRN